MQSDPAARRCAFKATVYRSAKCKGFVGYGDADPTNVSALVRGAEMRLAETRAVNRALRKAYGIGLCSMEETGSTAIPGPMVKASLCSATGSANSSASSNSILLWLSSSDYCGTPELRQASRDQILSLYI